MSGRRCSSPPRSSAVVTEAATDGLRQTASLGRYRRHGCRRSPLILDVRLFDAHGRALGLLLTAHEGVGTCGGRTPCARSTPRSTDPGVGSGGHRLGRPRRRGMVACRLRSTNTFPRGGRTCPGDGHRSGARRRHPQSDSRAGASARSAPLQPIGAVSYTWYLWHWPALVLAPYVVGHRLGLTQNLAVCLFSLLLAALTTVLLEQPVRRSPWLTARTMRSLVAGGALSLVAACAAVAIVVAVPPPVGSGYATASRLVTDHITTGGSSSTSSSAVTTADAIGPRRSTDWYTSRSPIHKCLHRSPHRLPTRRLTPRCRSTTAASTASPTCPYTRSVRGHDVLTHHRALRRLACPHVVPGHRQPRQ